VENGGNADGIIDKNDAVFSKLRVWQDLNHDGISQPDELKPLSAFDITGIDLHYQVSRYTDAYGNVFRDRSRIYRSNKQSDDRWTYDVLLLIGPVVGSDALLTNAGTLGSNINGH
jgi:hypothetical protein